jgi:hypothetical protein
VILLNPVAKNGCLKHPLIVPPRFLGFNVVQPDPPEVVLSSLVRHLTVKTEEGFYEMVF